MKPLKYLFILNKINPSYLWLLTIIKLLLNKRIIFLFYNINAYF